MNSYENQYLNILDNILKTGKISSNRTGTDTLKIWGTFTKIDLSEGFPLLTTKKLPWKNAFHEFFWMLSGDTNIQYLLKNGVKYWSDWPLKKYLDVSDDCADISKSDFEQTIIQNDEFAKKWGSIGDYAYGRMWRRYPSHTEVFDKHERHDVDQVKQVILQLKTEPDSRRIIITSWHPYHSNRKEDAMLPPCHNYIQFGTEKLTTDERYKYCIKHPENMEFMPGWTSSEETNIKVLDELNVPKYKLNCYYSMRSCDFFLGAPVDNILYALFTYLLCNELNMVPGELIHSTVDSHIYVNHIEQVKLQLTRSPKKLPTLKINAPGKSIFNVNMSDLALHDYDPYDSIKAPVAV